MIELFIRMLYGYWLVGAVFGLYVAMRGAARLDHDAEALTWPMRLLLLPGSVMLWPLLLRKLVDLKKTKTMTDNFFDFIGGTSGQWKVQMMNTQTGLNYLPAMARKLHHCRDLGEPFYFLTWFEYAPSDSDLLEELVYRLRQSEEWTYVDREIDIRLIRAQPTMI